MSEVTLSTVTSEHSSTTMEDSVAEGYANQYDVDEWDQMDDLQHELHVYDERKRRASMPSIPSPALLALAMLDDDDEEDDEDDGAGHHGGKQVRKLSMPTTLPSHQHIASRMAKAAGNSYFQCPSSVNAPSTSNNAEETPERPEECLTRILEGVNMGSFDSETLEHYFQAVTPERVRAHKPEVSRAIRKSCVDQLRLLVEQDVSLDGCNPQGESMISLACRLGKSQVVDYLVTEAKVSVRVRDDGGRTPLHDACWTCHPNFELIRIIVEDSPELLFIEDKRGYKALSYIPASCFGEWCKFLEDNQSFLRRRVTDISYRKAQDQLDEVSDRMQALMRRASNFGQ